ncbi:sensor histidine kinase [Sphingomonas colocasiae]|uniref:Histidine kinase n=1 Tax=Sphingomonas colocasiae TaxID=1848973 RepID=A0ABS7PRB2_9SPHN|nr:histidine kinase [Sphingomonas colocasiae]MBY8823880.1 histidine kinase [Sphingomonas colocasiae]
MTTEVASGRASAFDRRSWWREAGWIGVLYWVGAFLLAGALDEALGQELFGKMMLFALGLGLAALMAPVLMRTRRLSFPLQALIGLLLAIAATAIYVAADIALFRYDYFTDWGSYTVRVIAGNALFRWWIFFGWACLLLGLTYSHEIRDRDARLSAAREEALAAQMRALRYQINPHFLFNTLNSLRGLIEEGASARAGRMVQSLSHFLRATLTLDPMHDVRLDDELALQQGYLEIERERFADRMSVVIELAEGCGDALVPSLILQPLVENAVRYGVGETPGKVRIAIRAWRDGDRLNVMIENDMPAGGAPAHRGGTGIGLRNVRERIASRFSDDARFTHGPAGSTVYRAILDLPFRPAGG